MKCYSGITEIMATTNGCQSNITMLKIADGINEVVFNEERYYRVMTSPLEPDKIQSLFINIKPGELKKDNLFKSFIIEETAVPELADMQED